MDERAVIDSYLVLCQQAMTVAHRNMLMEECFPTFMDSASMVDSSQKVTDLIKTLKDYSRRTPANTRITIGPVLATKLVNMCLFIGDMLRIGIDPSAYDHAQAAIDAALVPPQVFIPDWDVFTLQRGISCGLIQSLRTRAISAPAPTLEMFPKFPTDMSSFHEYNNQTNAALKAVMGTNGVPLAYLVRDTIADPFDMMISIDMPNHDFIDASIKCCSRNHPGRLEDERALYALLYPRVVGTEALSYAPANHENIRLGSSFYTSIWGHYKENYVGQAQALNLDAKLNKLHYKSERNLQFTAFITQLNALWTQKETIGEGRDPPEKIRTLLAKIRRCPHLNSVVCTINARPSAEKLTEAHYMECVNQIATFIRHIDQGEPSATRRQVAEVNTSGRGGRGRGRGKGKGKGRGGHGGGRGRGGGAKYKRRGPSVDEWLDHTGRNVPNGIYRKWSLADQEKFKATRKRLKADTARTVAAIQAGAAVVAQVNTIPLPPPPPPPVTVPAEIMQMGRQAAANRARAISAANAANIEAARLGGSVSMDSTGNSTWN